MMVHCPHCDARALLVDIGVIHRPACLRCDRPLPMPPTLERRARGPMPIRSSAPPPPPPSAFA